jgi:hypothetical protein
MRHGEFARLHLAAAAIDLDLGDDRDHGTRVLGTGKEHFKNNPGILIGGVSRFRSRFCTCADPSSAFNNACD